MKTKNIKPLLWISCLTIVCLSLVSVLMISNPAQAQAQAASTKRVVGPGVCGLDAFNVRQKLTFLKLLPSSKRECINDAAYQAIIAFQKYRRLDVDGWVGKETRKKLYSTKKAPRLKKRGKSRRLEINLKKQILFVVRKNRIQRIISVSTGKPGYETPRGKYEIFRKEEMSWSVPFSVYLPWASYFVGGIAFHQGDVPNYPASHGCVRIPEAFAKYVYDFSGYGTQVVVR